MKLIFDINDKPKFSQIIVFAFQQMLAIMAATLLVPMIVSTDTFTMDPAAALAGAGLGTLVYLFFTKRKSPVFLGSSFAFLGAMGTAVAAGYGYWGLIIGALIAGLVYVIIAIVIHYTGTGWVNKLLPAVVIGPTVALIGLGLSSTATGWLMTNGGDTYNLVTILVGLVTFIVIVLASAKGNDTLKMIPFIIGIGAGYLFALLLTVIGTVAGVPELCVLDWSSIVNCFSSFTFESIFSLPGFTVVEGIKTGFSAIDGAAIGNIAVAFAPVAFVVLAEHIADHKNISSIIERDLLKDPGLTRTLLGDGVGSMVGAIFGGCPNTTYGESVGCVAITKNASIITIFAAAIGCIVLSFFSPFVAVINSIPKCVMGGACVALYGFIAVSGLQMLKNVDLGDTKNLFVVSSILVCGIGGLVINIDIGAANPLTITNVATALILGILVNTMLSAGKKANTHESVENLSVVSEEENK